jgi:hypothetical protein
MNGVDIPVYKPKRHNLDANHYDFMMINYIWGREQEDGSFLLQEMSDTKANTIIEALKVEYPKQKKVKEYTIKQILKCYEDIQGNFKDSVRQQKLNAKHVKEQAKKEKEDKQATIDAIELKRKKAIDETRRKLHILHGNIEIVCQ